MPSRQERTSMPNYSSAPSPMSVQFTSIDSLEDRSGEACARRLHVETLNLISWEVRACSGGCASSDWPEGVDRLVLAS